MRALRQVSIRQKGLITSFVLLLCIGCVMPDTPLCQGNLANSESCLFLDYLLNNKQRPEQPLLQPEQMQQPLQNPQPQPQQQPPQLPQQQPQVMPQAPSPSPQFLEWILQEAQQDPNNVNNGPLGQAPSPSPQIGLQEFMWPLENANNQAQVQAEVGAQGQANAPEVKFEKSQESLAVHEAPKSVEKRSANPENGFATPIQNVARQLLKELFYHALS